MPERDINHLMFLAITNKDIQDRLLNHKQRKDLLEELGHTEQKLNLTDLERDTLLSIRANSLEMFALCCLALGLTH